MPKAKPISLHSFTFEQVIDALIHAVPTPKAPKKKRGAVKPKKRKK